MIGQTVSHYKIIEKLGEGGMGIVYLAEDTKLNRKVALKFLPEQYASDPDIRARFLREAQTAASLNHPNIITIHEVGQHEDRPYIAMAYIEGRSLSEVMAADDFSMERAVDIGIQVCEGLDSAHKAGVVHRDIKPDNIRVDREGRVKILDFGLAKLKGVSRITQEQSTLGTLYYMSPEQVRGEDANPASDIFSLGAVLYEMFAGRLPFGGEHSAAVIYSITNETPSPPSQSNRSVPPVLDGIVSRALAKNRDQRYQTAGEVAADLRRFTSGLTPAAAGTRTNLLKYLLPTSAVFLAVILLIIFKPFRFEISPEQDAVAALNTLAIMYFDNFENRDDPGRLGEIVMNLLITDLSESGYLEVVSSQRLYDILKLEGMEGERTIDRTSASEVASRAGAKWMLLGSILQEKPTYVVTSQLVDVENGNVLASQRVTGEEGEKIFALVDRLTDEIKSDLALPAGAKREPDAAIADATTHSTEAYRYYIEGMNYVNKFYGQEADAAFDKALEYDSTFAMVYLHKTSGVISNTRADRRRLIARAVQYSDKVSEKERRFIHSRSALLNGDSKAAVKELDLLVEAYPKEKEAYRTLGDIYRGEDKVEKAIENYRKVVEIDPLDKGAYNVLAYSYQDIGDLDNYIWAIYQYMSLAPDEANPYDSRGDLYAYGGQVDKAIESYEEALKRKADFLPSIVKLGNMHVFQGDYDKAKGYYEQYLANEDDDVRAQGRLMLAVVPLYQGKFDEALEVLDVGIAGDEADGYDGPLCAAKMSTKAAVFAEQGRFEKAMVEHKRGLALHSKTNAEDPVPRMHEFAVLLAKKGDFEGAKTVLGDLKKKAEDPEHERIGFYWLTKGIIELYEGQANAAAASLDSVDVAPKYWFEYGYHLGVAYLESGRVQESVSVFETLQRRYSESRAFNPTEAVKMYYYLGRAYEEIGRHKRAIKQYEAFLDTWKNADPAIKEVKEAKERLAQLKVAG